MKLFLMLFLFSLLTTSCVHDLPDIPTVNDSSDNCNLTEKPIIDPASVIVEAQYISFHWSYTSNQVTGYRVERKEGGGTYAEVSSTENDSVTDEFLPPRYDSLFYYRVVAFSTNTCTITSDEISVYTLPLSPALLNAAPISEDSIELSWTDTNYLDAGYEIERSVNGSSFTLITEFPHGSGQDPDTIIYFTDTGLEPDTEYSYRVYGVNPDGRRSNSYEETSQFTLPASAEGFEVVSATSNELTVSWIDNYSNETGFNLVWRTENSLTADASSDILPINTDRHTISNLSPETTYYFWLYTLNTAGSSTPATANKATLARGITDLKATADYSDSITLTWVDDSTVETGFRVERSALGEDNDTVVETTAANATGIIDSSAILEPDKQYIYTIYVIVDTEESKTGEIIVVTRPKAPTNFIVHSLTSDSMGFSWTDTNTTEIAHLFLRSDGQSFTVEKNLESNTDNLSLAANTLYSYHLRAVNKGNDETNEKGWSLPITNQNYTRPHIPLQIEVNATTRTTNQIPITWTLPTGHDGTSYVVEARIDASSTWQTVDNGLSSVSTSFTHTGLSANQHWYYQVYLINPGGPSAPGVFNTWTKPEIGTIDTVDGITSASIEVIWRHSNGDNATYVLYRRPFGGAHSSIDTGIGTETTFIDESLETNKQYEYSIVFQNPGNVNSDFSAWIDGWTIPEAAVDVRQYPAPDATNPSPNTSTTIQFIGSNPNPNQTNYVLEKKLTSESTYSFAQSGIISEHSDASFTITVENLDIDEEYNFSLFLTNDAETSTAADFTAWTLPVSPSIYATSQVSDSELQLTWTAPIDNGAACTYEVRMKEEPSGSFNTWSTQSSPYNISDLSQGTTYTFQIRANHSNRYSINSAETSGTTRAHPILAWSTAPYVAQTVDGTGCILTIPGTATLDNATYNTSASYGSIDQFYSITDDANGITGIISEDDLGFASLGLFSTSWNVQDSKGGTASLSRNLNLQLASGATYFSPGTPNEPSDSHGMILEGMQVMDVQVPPDVSNGCAACRGQKASISAGSTHTCVNLAGGQPYCWGSDSDGQLGNDTQSSYLLPTTPVDSIVDAFYVTSNDAYSCSIHGGGGILTCWGDNTYGQVDPTNAPTDQQVPQLINTTIHPPTGIALGSHHACALVGHGNSPICWGDNSYGQIGNGTTSSVDAPTSVCFLGTSSQPSDPEWCQNNDAFIYVFSIAAGDDFTCAIAEQPSQSINLGVFCWGNGSDSRTGTDSTGSVLNPLGVCNSEEDIAPCIDTSEVLGPATMIAVGNMHGCALLPSQNVRCWGYGIYGQLGDNTSTSKNYASTTVVKSGPSVLSNVISITAGNNFSCAIVDESYGYVYCWGQNNKGQLGIGSTTPSSSNIAMQVCNSGSHSNSCNSGDYFTDAVAIDAGSSHVCAVKKDGTVWCWGLNTSGQLGIGMSDALDHTLPEQVCFDYSSGCQSYVNDADYFACGMHEVTVP